MELVTLPDLTGITLILRIILFLIYGYHIQQNKNLYETIFLLSSYARIAKELLAMEISPVYILLKQICPRTPSERTIFNISDKQPEENKKSEKS
ncbi:uncharacterized protein V1478_000760 [Vespula squamosa]|uniref:Uncharacterized protein n=1 Tax=Vespula squamosa TaxID=30214 RepID=A0ABD2C6E1_VESSQ